jgi:C-8 sterol isomerase
MSYVFDPDVLHDIANRAIGMRTDELVPFIGTELKARYPRHIETSENWIFNNAGGAMGMMNLFHASLSEYILLFGTPIGTEGHSGRYVTDVWDFMISGEMWTYTIGQMERQVFRPGDFAHLGRARAKGYRALEGTWMLEYSRGPIPLMLPFGLADTAFSTLDVPTLARTLGRYGRLVTRELFQNRKV